MTSVLRISELISLFVRLINVAGRLVGVRHGDWTTTEKLLRQLSIRARQSGYDLSVRAYDILRAPVDQVRLLVVSLCYRTMKDEWLRQTHAR